MRRLRLGTTAVLCLAFLAAVPLARADVADEERLAERYAPVVRLVEQAEECGYGEPYTPLDVDTVFGDATVALRGPWGRDLVKIGPSAADLGEGLYEYHLDFPGDALQPGCDYEHWADRLSRERDPTVYAHVATDATVPGKLALQYWFFYAFNDFNNKHEGDWEMIQLDFDATDAAEALTVEPFEVGYSQHEGAERAAWGDDKLEVEDDTHPVVHPAAGSHANYYEEALYLGRSAEQGIGCDDTSSPTVTLHPRVLTIPSDPAAARRAFPWIAYEGRWGELQEAFYNGPTGPNQKLQWTEPLTWAAEQWRDQSYAIPAGGLLGTGATDVFCSAVRTGSDALRRALDTPTTAVVALGIVLFFVLFAVTRTAWRPATPLRVARRRAWGQTIAAAARMYARRWHLFVGIGLVFLPITVLAAALDSLLVRVTHVGGELGGVLALIAVSIGALLTLGGLGLVQAATARALVELDARRSIGPVDAYRLALTRFPAMLGGLAIAVVVVTLLSLSVVLIPVALWLAGSWALLAQVAALEDATPLGALERSRALVRGRWFRVVSLVVVSAAVALAAGPILGALLIFATDAPFELLNIVAGVVYAVTMPFVALTTSYVYFDARVREELARESPDPGELPAEAELAT